jgi:hypothetical protein
MMEINQINITSGIVQVTKMLLNGAIIETCQKLNIIIGKVKIKAEKVIAVAVLISNISGINLNTLSKNFSV